MGISLTLMGLVILITWMNVMRNIETQMLTQILVQTNIINIITNQ